MKVNKIAFRHTFMATAIIGGLCFLAGCEKELINSDGNIPEGAMRINTEKQHTDTKTYVDGTAVYWVAGDHVNVNGQDKEVVVEGGIPYLKEVDNSVAMYAGYPSGIFSTVGATFSATLPATYQYSVDGSGKQILQMPMVGYTAAEGNTMEFKHLCATVNVKITNSLGVAYYVDTIVVSNDVQALCGAVTVTNPTNPSISKPAASAANKSVTLYFEKGSVSIANTEFKQFQIPVLPTTGGTVSVRIVGHGANGLDCKTGKIDVSGKIYYNNSTTQTLGRAQFFTAPCSMRSDIYAVSMGDYPKFTVSAGGTKVYFSRGNLQYNATESKWKFASNQYSYIGADNSNIGPSYDGWIDLFGWGTKTNPTNTSTTATDYSWHEWGENSISDVTGSWRTITRSELIYLIENRTTGCTVNGVSNARYTQAVVNSIAGVILFPDNFVEPTMSANSHWGTINATSSWSTFIQGSDWPVLEAAGCVFLPAAGHREGITMVGQGSNGYYWTTDLQSETTAYYMLFNSSNFNHRGNTNRSHGCSVRLVQTAN